MRAPAKLRLEPATVRHGGVRCDRQYCGEWLDERRDVITGRLSWACRACARNIRGLCRDCPRSLGSAKALRCEECRRLRALSRRNRYYAENRGRMLAQQKERAQRPEVREARRAYMAKYAASQDSAAGRAAARAYSKAWRSTPEGRAAVREANRRWREKNPEKDRAAKRRQYLRHRERYVEAERQRREKRRAARATGTSGAAPVALDGLGEAA